MSTFAGLNTAYTGLNAMRLGLTVTGQNVANASTEGYTRQKLNLTPASGAYSGSMYSVAPIAGSGVQMSGVSRMGDAFLDARLRTAINADAYSGRLHYQYSRVESMYREPTDNGIAGSLDEMWNAWQDVANSPNSGAAKQIVIEKSRSIASAINESYADLSEQWDVARSALVDDVRSINQISAKIAGLNKDVASLTIAGGNPNELLDMRNVLLNELSEITDIRLVEREHGVVDISINGNLLVSGSTSYDLKVSGATALNGVDADPVKIQWDRNPPVDATISGGDLGALIKTVAPANVQTTGGVIAEAAERFNKLAEAIATQVNALHVGGVREDGITAGAPIFDLGAGPFASTITVAVSLSEEIAAALPGQGGYNGGVADQIAQLSVSNSGPSNLWREQTVEMGIKASEANHKANVSAQSLTEASQTHMATTGVDLDEETYNMQMYQNAYAAASRVFSAIDEMLDILINRTGRVGL